MISLLGICADGLEDLVPAVRVSLDTLTARQSPLGYIPLNVGSDGNRSTANAGAVDSNLWYIIGHHLLDQTFGAQDVLERHCDAIERAMLWVRYQDSDDDGLIESQEAADWADLLANRGKVLYSNVLYAMALRAYAAMSERVGLPDPALHTQLAAVATARLNALHWVESDHGLWASVTSPELTGGHSESRRLVQATVAQLWGRPFYLPWVAFRDFGDWCDVLGNSLAILARVADPRRAGQILTYFDEVGVARPYPAKAIHPPIQPGQKDWRDYYRNGDRSLPEQYHNGGIWPFIGGFLVAALVEAGRHAEAAEQLERLAGALRESHDEAWEFNEWHHGRTGRPMGARQQAWSAALYLFAFRAVADGAVPCLDRMRVG
jgi:glycogen debranching enzyme